MFRRREPSPIAVRALGGFIVIRDGLPVPKSEWQSKKARDLLKILVARLGRPCAREYLMELLWPEEDPSKTTSRLSVALTIIRTIFDPDRRHDQDHFLSADRTTVGLELAHVEVDVERFLTGAEEGWADLEAGRGDDGIGKLAAAEALYGGDFLEENPYEDWAVPLREEARAAYIRILRRLAGAAKEATDFDSATRYLLRILEHDPFDERAHLELVLAMSASGRHGEARRTYRSYCARMAEIEVEAEPFPQVVAAAP
jgi:DNA-binding SARP family transcriptional activator